MSEETKTHTQIPGEPDRLIRDVYVWVAIDKRTGLEGIFAFASQMGMPLQAVTSSRQVAERMAENILKVPYSGKRFRLVHFKKTETLMEL